MILDQLVKVIVILRAPQSKSWFLSDLVVTTSDQRMDSIPTMTVTMASALPAATMTICVKSIAFHALHEWIRLRDRKRIKAGHGESKRHGQADPANEDRSKNIAHWFTPLGLLGI